MPATAPAPSLGSRDRQRLATREALFRAGLDEIRRVGLANAQVDRIAARCAVSRGTFYFHFPTKEDVLREWERRRQEEILERLDRPRRTPPALRGALLEVVDFLADLAASPDARLVLETLAIHVREGTDPRSYLLLDQIEGLLAAGRARGELRNDVDARAAATLFLSNVFGFLVSRTTSRPPHPGSELLVDLFPDRRERTDPEANHRKQTGEGRRPRRATEKAMTIQSRAQARDGDFAPPLEDPAFHAGDPFPAYRRLRAQPGLHRHASPEVWAVARHADVVAISRDPETFCSSRGTLLGDLERGVTPRQSILYIDPPEHAKYRKLVQPAFSPGRLRALEDWIRETTRQLLDELPSGRPFDFVEAFAAELPILVIAEMLGVPGSDRAQFKRWSDQIIAAGTDPTPENLAQAAELFQYFAGFLAERRQRPSEDLLSTLVQSEIDGERLEEFDLLSFCLTLLVAGNETTRNLLSHGVLGLATYPEALERLKRDRTLVPRAVEEMLRWGTPVLAFMRTATRDAVVSGTPVRAGERVFLLYASANRDESVFGEDAEHLRVTRDASGHVAFGFGEHFCMGAALARMEGRIVLEEMLARFSRIEQAGAVERVPSMIVRGIEKLPVVLA